MITTKETYMKKMDGKENMPVLEISYIVNTGRAFDDGMHKAQRDEAIRRLKANNADLSGII